ncbi:MAG: MFS transporter [Candidatus Hodarchaeales archaeon]|jgi:MFS family permease
MIIKPLMTVLRTQNLPNRAQTLVQKIVIAVIFMQFVWTLSETFYVLFVIDSVGYADLGLLLAISFLLQSCLDYPSGALGDWIGQKWILFGAFLTFGLSFAILAVSQSFETLLVVYCLQALAASQESGALMTWFDNNYKISAEDADPERTTYKFFFGRWGLITNVTGATGFVVGGIVATLYFRQAVFAFQAIALIIIGFSFLFFLNDFPEVERPKKSVRNYVRLLGEGIAVVFRDKALLLFILSICCFGMLWTVWWTMILFPLYFGYTGSDGGASLFRFTAWILGLPSVYFAANLAAKLDIKWIPRLHFIHTLMFFPLFILLTFSFPIGENRFEPIAIALTLTIFSITVIFENIAGLLEQRIFLDAVPDKNRNSVYSLVPTMILIASAPMVIIGGYLIVNFGVPLTLICMGLLALVASAFSFIAIHLMAAEKPTIPDEPKVQIAGVPSDEPKVPAQVPG